MISNDICILNSSKILILQRASNGDDKNVSYRMPNPLLLKHKNIINQVSKTNSWSVSKARHSVRNKFVLTPVMVSVNSHRRST